MTAAYAHRLADYHVWRTRKLAAAVDVLTQEHLQVPTPGSYANLGLLVAHLAGSDRMWLARLNGESLAQIPVPSFAGGSELARAWQDAAEAVAAHIHALNDAGLARTVHYTNTRGDAFANPVADIWAHVVDHASYHAGQVADRLRAMGQVPPSTNLVFFLRAR